MGVVIYSFNLNISPQMSYGVLECDSVMLQTCTLMFYNKRFCNKKGALFVLGPPSNYNRYTLMDVIVNMKALP